MRAVESNMTNNDKLLRIESRSSFPKVLNIETTNVCNLKCPMCPRTDLMTRSAVHMDISLFHRIADEAAEYGVNAVWLQDFGEPLLHPKIGEMIRYLKDKGNIHSIGISTNCNLLTDKRGRAVLEAGLDRIILSIDAVEERTYAQVRGGAFEKVKQNVRSFLELRRELGAATIAQISCIDMDLNRSDVEQFRSEWQDLLRSEDEVLIKGFTNFGGQIDAIQPGAEQREMGKVPCRKLWNSMTILSRGEVVACCYDVNGQLEVGNLNDSTLSELWKGAQIQRMRALHREGRFDELPMCGTCSAIQRPVKADRPAKPPKPAKAPKPEKPAKPPKPPKPPKPGESPEPTEPARPEGRQTRYPSVKDAAECGILCARSHNSIRCLEYVGGQ